MLLNNDIFIKIFNYLNTHDLISVMYTCELFRNLAWFVNISHLDLNLNALALAQYNLDRDVLVYLPVHKITSINLFCRDCDITQNIDQINAIAKHCKSVKHLTLYDIPFTMYKLLIPLVSGLKTIKFCYTHRRPASSVTRRDVSATLSAVETQNDINLNIFLIECALMRTNNHTIEKLSWRGNCIDGYLLTIALPQLKRLHVYNCCINSFGKMCNFIRHNITKLKLIHCTINGTLANNSTIAEIIQLYKLEKFVIHTRKSLLNLTNIYQLENLKSLKIKGYDVIVESMVYMLVSNRHQLECIELHGAIINPNVLHCLVRMSKLTNVRLLKCRVLPNVDIAAKLLIHLRGNKFRTLEMDNLNCEVSDIVSLITKSQHLRRFSIFSDNVDGHWDEGNVACNIEKNIVDGNSGGGGGGRSNGSGVVGGGRREESIIPHQNLISINY